MRSANHCILYLFTQRPNFFGIGMIRFLNALYYLTCWTVSNKPQLLEFFDL